MSAVGLSDAGLLERLAAIYGEAFVLASNHERLTFRMHGLREFMKTLDQQFTQWFYRTHLRSGSLWKDVFRSPIVKDGAAAKVLWSTKEFRKESECRDRGCCG